MTTTDNDVPGLVVDATDLTTNGGGTATCTPALTTQPARAQTVTVGAGEEDDAVTWTHDPSGADSGSVANVDLAFTANDDTVGAYTIGNDDGGAVLNRRLFLRCVGLIPAAFLGGVNLLSGCRSVLKAHPLCSEIPEDIQALYSPDFCKAFPDPTLCELREKLFDKRICSWRGFRINRIRMNVARDPIVEFNNWRTTGCLQSRKYIECYSDLMVAGPEHGARDHPCRGVAPPRLPVFPLYFFFGPEVYRPLRLGRHNYRR